MAKYDSLRKLERNRMLREYAGAHPELSLKEIGRMFRISESRVWRILHDKSKDPEIIGNIYEHPELVRKKGRKE